MNGARWQRRGAMLVVVLVAMTAVGGLLAILAAGSAHRYREHQADRVRQTLRAVTDSAAAHARTRLDDWSVNPPEKPVVLEVNELLEAKMTGSARLSLVEIEGQRVCRVSAQVKRGIYGASEEIDLPVVAGPR